MVANRPAARMHSSRVAVVGSGTGVSRKPWRVPSARVGYWLGLRRGRRVSILKIGPKGFDRFRAILSNARAVGRRGGIGVMGKVELGRS